MQVDEKQFVAKFSLPGPVFDLLEIPVDEKVLSYLLQAAGAKAEIDETLTIGITH